MERSSVGKKRGRLLWRIWKIIHFFRLIREATIRFYFAEEVFSTYEYKQSIKANDRATMLNLMKGLNGYTLCSGIICENLNGSEYCAVKLSTEETMTIGYLKRKGIPLSSIGKEYLKEISKYNVTIQHTIIPRGDFGMNMPKSRDMQVKIPSPKAIFMDFDS